MNKSVKFVNASRLGNVRFPLRFVCLVFDMNKRGRALSLSPVLPAKQPRESNPPCILCHDSCDEKQKLPQDEHWLQFKENVSKWRGLDKYGTAADSIEWDTGPLGKFWHKGCKAEVCGERKLKQAIARSKKVSQVVADEKTVQPDCSGDERPATRKSIGPVHNSSLCIWCMTGYNKKKPDKRDELHLVVNRSTWQRIVASVPLMKDDAKRARLEVLVNGTTEPLRAGIKYHSKCFLDYVTKAEQEEAESKIENHGSLDIAHVKEMF